MSGSVIQQAATTLNDGWTIFTPTSPSGSGSSFAGAGTRIIYVSSSTGNDSTGDGTQGNPYASINKGSSFLRSGHDDWLLLKCGDTWTDDAFSITGVGGVGASVSPTWQSGMPQQWSTHTVSGVTLWGSYGTGSRPLIKIGGAVASSGYMNATNGSHNNFAIVGLEIYGYTRDPANGSFSSTDANNNSLYFFGVHDHSANIILENNKCSFMNCFFFADQNSAFGFSSFHDTIILNRNIIVDQYGIGTDSSQGVLFIGGRNYVLNENVFDHNGWNATVTGATQNVQNHNLYAAVPNSNSNNYIRGNIFANDPGGAQFRSGGTIYNNLFVQNSATFNAGVGNVSITYNVISEGRDIPAPNTLVQGLGPEISPCIAGAVMANNIVSNCLSSDGGDWCYALDAPGGGGDTRTGNFTSGSTTVTNVTDNSMGLAAFQPGIALFGPLVPANTFVVSASGFDAFGGGTTGTVVMSNPATGNGTAQTFNRGNANAIVTNNIGWKWTCTNGACSNGVADLGTNTTNSGNYYDPTGANTGGYPAPTRTVETYDTLLGGPGTVADFLSRARTQSKAAWVAANTANACCNHMRAGFSMAQL